VKLVNLNILAALVLNSFLLPTNSFANSNRTISQIGSDKERVNYKIRNMASMGHALVSLESLIVSLPEKAKSFPVASASYNDLLETAKLIRFVFVANFSDDSRRFPDNFRLHSLRAELMSNFLLFNEEILKALADSPKPNPEVVNVIHRETAKILLLIESVRDIYSTSKMSTFDDLEVDLKLALESLESILANSTSSASLNSLFHLRGLLFLTYTKLTNLSVISLDHLVYTKPLLETWADFGVKTEFTEHCERDLALKDDCLIFIIGVEKVISKTNSLEHM